MNEYDNINGATHYWSPYSFNANKTGTALRGFATAAVVRELTRPTAVVIGMR